MMIPDQTTKPQVYYFRCQYEALSSLQYFTSALQRSLDFTHHKHANLINKSYINRKYLTRSLPAAVHSSGSSEATGIHFVIEFTWHVPRLLIWILSVIYGSSRGQSVCLTDVDFFLLSLLLWCAVVSDIISTDTEKESSYINMSWLHVPSVQSSIIFMLP